MKPYMVRCKKCRYKISITAGTIFQDLHIPLRLIFQAMWYMVCQKQGVNAVGLKSILGVGSYETTWSWLHKFRTAMVRPGRDRLSGTVEVDETLVGGSQPGKRGRGAEKKELVLVAVEDHEKKGMGRIRLKHIPSASSITLEKGVTELIEPGSTVRTDGWKGYSKLEKKGYTFKSSSDTEVVLNLYLEYGPDAIRRLNGMFALVIWDESKNTFFAARDHMGIKPFFYSIQNGTFYFASEIKAILANPDFKKELDEENIGYYLTFKNRCFQLYPCQICSFDLCGGLQLI